MKSIHNYKQQLKLQQEAGLIKNEISFTENQNYENAQSYLWNQQSNPGLLNDPDLQIKINLYEGEAGEIRVPSD